MSWAKLRSFEDAALSLLRKKTVNPNVKLNTVMKLPLDEITKILDINTICDENDLLR